MNQHFLWVILVITHLAAALFSRGYYHFDEHFQVLEFLQWKLGRTPTEAMPWELTEAMRPWTHPLLFYPLEWASHHFLSLSPFTKTALHRLVPALLALLAIHRLQRDKSSGLLFLYTILFFLPFLDARISSEIIGGETLALAFAWDERPQGRFKGHVVVGALLGLASVIRFHLWIMVGGLALFHVLQQDFRRVGGLALGATAVLVLAVFIDRWGYNTWTFVPWNYLHQNLLLHKSSQWGISPWYAYVTMLVVNTAYLPGIVILVALLWQWWKRPLSKLTLMTVPFVAIHLVVGHKELRFLFPMVYFLPLCLFALWEDTKDIRAAKSIAYVFITLDLLLLIPTSLHDANPYIGLYQILRDNPRLHGATLCYQGENPLRPGNLAISYYLGDLGLQATRLPEDKIPSGLVIMDRLGAYLQLRDEARCQLLGQRYSAWAINALANMSQAKPRARLKMWSLWSCP